MRAQSVPVVKAKSAASNSNQSSLCQQDAHTRRQKDKKTHASGRTGTGRMWELKGDMDLLSEEHTAFFFTITFISGDNEDSQTPPCDLSLIMD